METPFNIIILGTSRCGKTSCLLNMIEKDNKHFGHIILICSTFEWNRTYQEWKYIKDNYFITIHCEQDCVDAILKHVTDIYKGTNTLNFK